MVHQACKLGLSTYAQTEHAWLPRAWDPHHGDSMSSEQLAFYLRRMSRLRDELQESGSSMELIVGAELDWVPTETAFLGDLAGRFEYVLGSVHFIDGQPIDYEDGFGAWSRYGVDGTWERYISAWLDMVRSPVPFTCFAHPDLPKKYGRLPSFDLQDAYREMAQAVARRGGMVEVNTAGLEKPVGECYPSLALLREFHRAGVDCTVGADAHAPFGVGAGIELAYGLMRRAGYGRVAVPCADGTRRYIALED